MKRYLFMMLTLFSYSVSYAQIYKWTDASGIVHFSDIPHQGAETVNLPKVQTHPAKPSEQTSESPSKPAIKSTASSGDSYEQVSITEPENESTIRNNQGVVPVMVSLKPPLMEGHQLQLIFDDRVMGAPQVATSFVLNGVERGSHTIAVNVIDSQGAVVATTEKITVYMHRPRVNMGKGSPGG
jgi:hypothetical protein